MLPNVGQPVRTRRAGKPDLHFHLRSDHPTERLIEAIAELKVVRRVHLAVAVEVEVGFVIGGAERGVERRAEVEVVRRVDGRRMRGPHDRLFAGAVAEEAVEDERT